MSIRDNYPNLVTALRQLGVPAESFAGEAQLKAALDQAFPSITGLLGNPDGVNPNDGYDASDGAALLANADPQALKTAQDFGIDVNQLLTEANNLVAKTKDPGQTGPTSRPASSGTSTISDIKVTATGGTQQPGVTSTADNTQTSSTPQEPQGQTAPGGQALPQGGQTPTETGMDPDIAAQNVEGAPLWARALAGYGLVKEETLATIGGLNRLATDVSSGGKLSGFFENVLKNLPFGLGEIISGFIETIKGFFGGFFGGGGERTQTGSEAPPPETDNTTNTPDNETSVGPQASNKPAAPGKEPFASAHAKDLNGQFTTRGTGNGTAAPQEPASEPEAEQEAALATSSNPSP